MPRAFEIPIPSDPEFASIPGMPTSGWPSSPCKPTETQQALGRHEPESVERRVEPGDVVSLGREEHVAAWMVEPERDRVHLLVEQVHDDVEGAEARAEMARACPLDRNERIRATHVGEERETLVAIDARGGDTRERRRRYEHELDHGADCRSDSYGPTSRDCSPRITIALDAILVERDPDASVARSRSR